jgi:hypothetical protein
MCLLRTFSWVRWISFEEEAFFSTEKNIEEVCRKSLQLKYTSVTIIHHSFLIGLVDNRNTGTYMGPFMYVHMYPIADREVPIMWAPLGDYNMMTRVDTFFMVHMYNIPKRENVQKQIPIPKGNNIFQMALECTNIFLSKALQNIPKMECKYTILKPWC